MYAYLLSTLPSFELHDPPPMSASDLVARCRGFLADDELAALEDPERGASLDGEVGSVARRWLDEERQLRNALARRRAAAWGVAPAPYLREHQGFRVDIEEGVARAYEAADPMARERAIDALRWRLAGELAGLVPWGFAALFAYAQRLRLAGSWASRGADAGRVALEGALDRLEERYG